mmetsp:Transcript_12620/g.25529  ORF Transcript_12620/g.25529 Transcript_12620/m.25529 type:complete len:80 (-) Transcript_12620:852-1091(-)
MLILTHNLTHRIRLMLVVCKSAGFLGPSGKYQSTHFNTLPISHLGRADVIVITQSDGITVSDKCLRVQILGENVRMVLF